MHIKTVILLEKVSFGLIKFLNLSTTIFIQRFLKFALFSHKNASFDVFILRIDVSYIYGFSVMQALGYINSGLLRPILKNLGILGFFKKPKKPEKLGFLGFLIFKSDFFTFSCQTL